MVGNPKRRLSQWSTNMSRYWRVVIGATWRDIYFGRWRVLRAQWCASVRRALRAGVAVCVCVVEARWSVYRAVLRPARAWAHVRSVRNWVFRRLLTCISVIWCFSFSLSVLIRSVLRRKLNIRSPQASSVLFVRLIKNIGFFGRMRWINFANRVCVSKRFVRAMLWSDGEWLWIDSEFYWWSVWYCDCAGFWWGLWNRKTSVLESADTCYSASPVPASEVNKTFASLSFACKSFA